MYSVGRGRRRVLKSWRIMRSLALVEVGLSKFRVGVLETRRGCFAGLLVVLCSLDISCVGGTGRRTSKSEEKKYEAEK